MEYKRSTFQLGLQARNVNNQRKIIAKDRTAFFISNRFNVNNKEKTKGRRYEIREVKKRDKRTEDQKTEEKIRKSRRTNRRKKKKREEMKKEAKKEEENIREEQKIEEKREKKKQIA